jgi:glycosyltransferase involved in cell wall biosynthesis
MKPAISLCMIVRNEQEHLAACLESVRGVVDEMVVVDTGSLDNTVEIARARGARVVAHAWEGSFSIPRNISLAHARGEWVLILDADEKLAEEAGAALAALIRNRNASGYRLLIELHPEWTEMRSLRLFRNSPMLRFSGVFHEELTIPAEHQAMLRNANARIIHKPWCQEDFNRKLTRNMGMLKSHMKEYPDGIYQLLDLIRLHEETGQLAEAEELLQQAYALILKKNYDEKKYQFYITQYYQYQLRLLTLTRAAAETILSLCKQALLTAPSCPFFLFEAAQRYYRLHEYDSAIGYFQECIALGTGNNFDRSVIFPRYMMSHGALSGLGFCFFRKKKYPDALRYFGESYALKKDENIKAMIMSSELLAQQSQPLPGSCTQV